ncbi:hypothetical protein XK86_01125 [Hafnia alvei]|nr:hypothetical protein XK86_01125 [Hafnia alvei]
MDKYQTAPSQPPPCQGEGLSEIHINIAEQFPPLRRGELGWINIRLPPSQLSPCQGEGPIEIHINITEQFPPLRRGGLGWGAVK